MVRRRKEGYRRGAAALELALAIIPILMVTFGTIKYGWLYLKAQQVTNAARYGARVAIRAGSSTDEVLDAIDDLLGPTGANISDPCSPTVTFLVNDVVVANLESVTIEVGDAITVEIRVSASNTNVDIMPQLPLALFPSPSNLGAVVTMAKEGF